MSEQSVDASLEAQAHPDVAGAETREPVTPPAASVIVPVYNVEPYLDRCVDSILRQTLADFELILVDDGSTDKSGEMCDQYASRDQRIQVIHKQNGGLSDARNAGIDMACGTYLSFVDSDDYIEPDMLRDMLDAAQRYDADVVQCGINDCYEGRIVPNPTFDEPLVFDGVGGLRYAITQSTASICNKLVRRDTFAELRFPFGRFYEDAFLTPKLLVRCTRMVVLGKNYYNYWRRPNSITTESFVPRHLDIIAAAQENLQLAKSENPTLIDVFEFALDYANINVFDRMLLCDNYKGIPEYRDVLAHLRRRWYQMVSSPYFQRSRRFAIAVLRCSVPAYRMLVIQHRKRVAANQ